MPPPGVDYVTWSLKRSREAPAPGALTQEKQRAVDALSPRSKRAYRLGPVYGYPPFDPRLGSCPYDFPMYGDDYLNSVKGQQELKENAAASSKRRRVSPVRITGAATDDKGCMPPVRIQPRSDPVSIIGCMPEGQTTLDAVEATMTEIVKDMERTRPMCLQILEDPSLRIWLPAQKQETFIFQHIVSVVRALLSWRPCIKFKVGLTIDPAFRFGTPTYAYSNAKTHLRDGVIYEGMHVVLIKESRKEIALAEHLMMNYFLNNAEFDKHCANKKLNKDTSFENDDSDDERFDAKGPYALYISWGSPGPYHRD